MSPMTASATSGYQDYAEINGSMSPMTVLAYAGMITETVSGIAGAFEGMTMDARCLTGENTLENTASLPAMTMLATSHTSVGKVYASATIKATATLNTRKTFGGYPSIAATSALNAVGYSGDAGSIDAYASIRAASTTLSLIHI